MRRNVPRPQPARCSCMGGGNRAKEHSKPGATAAEHGNVFAHAGACVHSELSNTTRPMPKARTVTRLKLQ